MRQGPQMQGLVACRICQLRSICCLSLQRRALIHRASLLEAPASEAAPASGFEGLRLRESILAALRHQNLLQPTEIQASLRSAASEAHT